MDGNRRRVHGFTMATEARAAADVMREIARPIHGEAELGEIVPLIAEKRLVLLGEATHGSREFYDLRASLTRRLIADHGFAAVAVEGDWPDALRVDHFV